MVAEKYGLTELVELGRAATKGDIRTYNHIMDTYQRSFIKIGVYLVLEQVKHIVYRSLCKRIYNILGNTRVNLVSSILYGVLWLMLYYVVIYVYALAYLACIVDILIRLHIRCSYIFYCIRSYIRIYTHILIGFRSLSRRL